MPGQEKKTGKLDRNTQDLALTSTCELLSK